MANLALETNKKTLCCLPSPDALIKHMLILLNPELCLVLRELVWGIAGRRAVKWGAAELGRDVVGPPATAAGRHLGPFPIDTDWPMAVWLED